MELLNRRFKNGLLSGHAVLVLALVVGIGHAGNHKAHIEVKILDHGVRITKRSLQNRTGCVEPLVYFLIRAVELRDIIEAL